MAAGCKNDAKFKGFAGKTGSGYGEREGEEFCLH